MKRLQSNGCARGFSLVEMLVVMAIIGILAALLLPAIQKARPRAQRLKCISNLRQVGMAFHSFAHEHGDQFPMQVSTNAGGSKEYVDASRLMEGDFYFSYRHFEPLAPHLGSPELLICPADTRRPAISFAALQNSSLSYFVSPQAAFGKALSILAGDRNITNNDPGARSIYRVDANTMARWTHELHHYRGNLLFADGRVEQANGVQLAVTTASDSMLPAELYVPAAAPGVSVPAVARGPAVTAPPPAPPPAPVASGGQASGVSVTKLGSSSPAGLGVPVLSTQRVVAINANTPIGITVIKPIPAEPPPATPPAPKVKPVPAPVLAPVAQKPAQQPAPALPPETASAPVAVATSAPTQLPWWLFVLLALLALLIAWLIRRRVRASEPHRIRTSLKDDPWLHPDDEEDYGRKKNRYL